jgi:hypothetical protein
MWASVRRFALAMGLIVVPSAGRNLSDRAFWAFQYDLAGTCSTAFYSAKSMQAG